MRTILDANVVTCITALVLFAVATASVKGFALMLLIGTVVSLATAVAATRAMLGLLAGFRGSTTRASWARPRSEIPRWQRWDVVGRRRLWFVLSLVAIGVSVVALAVQGLNLGIDFKGGVQVTLTTPKPTSLAAVRAQVDRATARSSRARGASTGGTRTTSFQIRLRELPPPSRRSSPPA